MKTDKASPFYIPTLSEFKLSNKIFQTPIALYGEYPRRVSIGDTIFEDENGKILSSVNGIASIDLTDQINLVQDGNLKFQSKKELSQFGKSEFLNKLNKYALISLDFKNKSIFELFKIFKPDGKIVFSPFTRENFFSYKDLILENFKEEFEFFKVHLEKLFPDASLLDFFNDKTLNKEYPIGIPEYFINKKLFINETKFPHENILYFGGETIFHLIRTLYYNIPFHERLIQFLFIEKKGKIKKESKWLKNGTKLDFTEFEDEFPFFSLNCFYKSDKIFNSKESFNLDIYSTYGFIFSTKSSAENLEQECSDCNDCNYFCPTNAIPRNLLYRETSKFLVNQCIECGICSLICPSKIDLHSKIKTEKQKNEN